MPNWRSTREVKNSKYLVNRTSKWCIRFSTFHPYPKYHIFTQIFTIYKGRAQKRDLFFIFYFLYCWSPSLQRDQERKIEGKNWRRVGVRICQSSDYIVYTINFNIFSPEVSKLTGCFSISQALPQNILQVTCTLTPEPWDAGNEVGGV